MNPPKVGFLELFTVEAFDLLTLVYMLFSPTLYPPSKIVSRRGGMEGWVYLETEYHSVFCTTPPRFLFSS